MTTPIGSPNLSIPFINTPLHLATYFGDRLRAVYLLAHGADTEALTANDYTALHVAALLDQRGVMTVLLANRANTAARDRFGFTPLHYAAQEGYHRAVHILLVRGNADVEARNSEGETALHCAVVADNSGMLGAVNVVKVLLDNGADSTAKENNGYLASQLAVGPNKEELKRLLQ